MTPEEALRIQRRGTDLCSRSECAESHQVLADEVEQLQDELRKKEAQISDMWNRFEDAFALILREPTP